MKSRLEIKIPRARKMGFTLLLLATLFVQGCCTCRERYAPFLEHTEKSLRDSVAPALDKALKASGRPDDLRKNDVGEVTDLADACERIRTQGADAWKPGAQEGGDK